MASILRPFACFAGIAFRILSSSTHPTWFLRYAATFSRSVEVVFMGSETAIVLTSLAPKADASGSGEICNPLRNRLRRHGPLPASTGRHGARREPASEIAGGYEPIRA